MKKDAINLLEKGSWEVARDKVVLHTGWWGKEWGTERCPFRSGALACRGRAERSHPAPSLVPPLHEFLEMILGRLGPTCLTAWCTLASSHGHLGKNLCFFPLGPWSNRQTASQSRTDLLATPRCVACPPPEWSSQYLTVWWEVMLFQESSFPDSPKDPQKQNLSC